MPAYRYKTAVMVGRWQPTRRDAMRDAVRAGIARWDGSSWDKVKWLFGGEIEERAGAPD